MTDENAVTLTAQDFTLLESLVHNWGEPFPGAGDYIRRKLAAATVVFPEDLPPDVVGLNSRVRFRVGMALAEERTIVGGPSEAVHGMSLKLTSPRALALIGAAVGQTVQARRHDGSTELLVIEAIPHQAGRPSPAVRLKIVSSQELRDARNVASPARSWVVARRFGDDDDPGPNAA
jgi:regulator of nucleoside diphosphate kinase